MDALSPSAGRYLSPMRYPGGKAKLASYMKLLLSKNNLEGGEYVEVYAGGASVALALLLDGYVSRIHLNDIDPGVHAFWHSVLHDSEALCKLIRNKRVSVAEWDRQKAIYHDVEDQSPVHRGFATFFLNRTNRSGIISSAGMIGGRKQAGDYRLNARYNKKDLIKRIERIADRAHNVELHQLDGAELLTKLVPTLPSRTLVYLDPPYYVKGGRRLYANSYHHDDHCTIAKLIAKSERPWAVSYDNAPEIRRMYSAFRHRTFSLSYTATTRSVGEEILFFSSRLKIPRVKDPVSTAIRQLAQNARTTPTA